MKKTSRILGSICAIVLMLVLFITVINGGSNDHCSVDSGSSADGGVPSGAYSLPEHNALDPQNVKSEWRTPDRPDHRGIDIAQAIKTPIFAFADGVVVAAGPASGFGQWIVIDHKIDGKLYSTVYGHMFPEDIFVKTGDTVKAGKHIADQGYNGEVIPAGPGGSHVHFEVWEGGRLGGGHDVNPRPWLEKAVEPGSGGGSVAKGDEVLLIGDSLTVGAKQEIQKAIPSVSIDAKVGRQYSEGLDILESKNPKVKTVIMALGTNGPFTQGHIDRTLKAANGATVILTTVAGPRVTSGAVVNLLVEQNKSKVVVADWAAQVREHGDYVGPDGIHLTESGKQAFATMLADAVQAKVNAASPKKSGKSGKSGKKKSRKSSGELPDSDKIVSEEHMQIDTIRIARAVAQRFPEIETIGGWRPYDAYPDHPSGRAADIMIPHWDTEEGKKLGDEIMEYLWGNREYFQVEYFIWRQRYSPAQGESNIMEDRGSPTQNHFDHIHVTTQGHGFPKPGQKYGSAPDGNSAAPPDGGGSVDDCDSVAGVDEGLDTNGEIPEAFVKWIKLSGKQCKAISPPLIAALLEQESRFSTTAISPAGATGPAQFTPDTWVGHGAKVDDNGKPIGPPGSGDPNDIPDAVMAAGRLLCKHADSVAEWKSAGLVSGDDTELILAAYNAGPGNVQEAHGVPAFPETQHYVKVIPENAKKFKEKVK